MKNEIRTQHLTDAEFSRLLDGAQAGASAESHLAYCGYCRQELEVVQDSLGTFRSLATTWAELEAPRHVPLPARWAERLHLQTSWSKGLATTALTGLLVFWLGFAPQTQQARQAPDVNAPVAAPTNAELAADNRLLLSIDEELSDQSQPVVSAAPAQSEPAHTTHRTVGTITD